MDIREYLKSKGIDWREVHRPSGLNAVANCPFCDDREHKFAINLETGAFGCMHENRCGAKGSWTDFQRRFNDNPRPLDGKSRIIPAAKRAYQEPRPAKKFLMPEGGPLEYLKGRGFTEETIRKYKLAMVDEDTLAFPYYRNGKLVNIKYRSIAEKKFWSEKNCEPVLFNRDNIPENADWLIITEGEFDAVALCQYGFDAVSIPGGASNLDWIEHEWDWLQRFKEIMLCMDGDQPGQECAEKSSKRLGIWRCKLVTLPRNMKDANGCLQAGVPREEIQHALIEARDYCPDTLYSADRYTEDVVAMIEKPDQLSGYPTAFEGLTKLLGGWRYPEFTVWSGQNSSGKSTVLNQVVIDLIAHDVPCCVASLEMPPKRYLRWAVVQFTEETWPKPDRVRTAMRTMGRNLYVVDLQGDCEIDALLDVFRYAARRYGCRHFIIDSLMMVKTDQRRELEQQASICKKYCMFAKEYNVHAHLVAHPRKGTDDDERPGKVDVMGTGHITNLADNVMIMWRPSEELKEKARKKADGEIPPDAVLYLKKNREEGTQGKVKLWFDSSTKRFSEDA